MNILHFRIRNFIIFLCRSQLAFSDSENSGKRITAVYGFLFLIILLSVILLSSCSPAKNAVYFENLKKDTTLHNLVSKDFEPKIQKGDVLAISVASLSPDVGFYNNIASAGTSSSTGATGAANGYPVDENGNIDFIKLGILHAEGLTKKELKAAIEKGLVPYLKDVIVNISFSNRHVTMLGGLNSQVLPMAGDNMTILDALAASGDIGVKGKIDNVLVIREKDNGKVFKRLNLKDNSVFYSPYFYMQPNDIVYVEPIIVKPPITTAQIISYVTSGISLIILLLNTVKL